MFIETIKATAEVEGGKLVIAGQYSDGEPRVFAHIIPGTEAKTIAQLVCLVECFRALEGEDMAQPEYRMQLSGSLKMAKTYFEKELGIR